MDVEVVVCSASGKPIFHYERSRRDADFNTTSSSTSHSSHAGAGGSDDGGCRGDVSSEKSSFVSSLQGLLSFVSCMQHEELEQLQTDGCRCYFETRENLTFAVILRSPPVQSAAEDTLVAAEDATHCEEAPIEHGSNGGVVDTVPDVPIECLQRLVQLLHSQILFVLTDRGLDVLRRQPGYDLRDLLSGTERVMTALCERWATDPALRFHGLGVPFVRLAPDQRLAITRTLELNSAGSESSSHTSNSSSESAGSASTATICGLLLADKRVVAVSQPNKKQFSILVDDLLLLLNFVYHTPSLAKSETWTPICLPSFNASGFLYAYVVFLTADVCLLLLSSQQSPEQFHAFHAKKARMAQRLESSGALQHIHCAVQRRARWAPHSDLPLLAHFVYKSELTGEYAAPELGFPFASDNDTGGDSDGDSNGDSAAAAAHMLNQYAKLHHRMYPSRRRVDRADATATTAGRHQQQHQALGKRQAGLHDVVASRLAFARSESGLFIGQCTDEYRLYACFDALVSVAEAREQCQLLVERLRRDETLMAPPFFSSSSGSALLMWP